LEVTIERVDIVDGDTGALLSRIEDDEVGTLFVPVPLGVPPSGAVLGPGASAFLVLDAALAPAARVPRRLDHVFRLSFDPPVPEIPDVVPTGATEVVSDQPAVIGAPLRGTRWVAANGCCAASAHRTAIQSWNGEYLVAQRFAIDLVQLDADGRLSVGPPDQLSSHPFYGVEVISAAAGVVVWTQDGVPTTFPAPCRPWTRRGERLQATMP
jgi:hypothetical protein